MALPKLQNPTNIVTIPSTKEKITIRPFLVKEEKILLMALQGDDAEEMVRATKQIINNCVVSPNFDIDTLEIYDLEYLLLQLRIMSQGETTKIRFKAREGVDCLECTKPRTIEINLREATIKEAEGHSKKIQLTDELGLVMKYPTTKMMAEIESAKSKESIEQIFAVLWLCVDSVFDNSKVYKASDYKIEEGVEFLESLNKEQFAQIEHFFTTMPKLKQTVHIHCELCGFKQDYELVGLDNFFG